MLLIAMFFHCGKLTDGEKAVGIVTDATALAAFCSSGTGISNANLSFSDKGYYDYTLLGDNSGYTVLLSAEFKAEVNKASGGSYLGWTTGQPLPAPATNWKGLLVTSMAEMFESCSTLTSLDLSNFNTAQVTSMKDIFRDCQKLTSLDISNFNTAQVTDMSFMFNNCLNLTSLDVSKFNTEKVTAMNHMFLNCNSLSKLDVSNFNTANVTDMRLMF